MTEPTCCPTNEQGSVHLEVQSSHVDDATFGGRRRVAADIVAASPSRARRALN